MTRKYFGTDGIRGLANVEPITPGTVLKLAMAAGSRFRRGDHRHLVVIGKDTRLSGYMLEPALAAGFTAMGMDVHMVGPMPTPAVAMLTRSLRADLGVVISASHNLYQDNGIKLFGPDGYKLSDEEELEIESLMDNGGGDLAPSERLGRAKRLEDAPGRYIEFVKQSFPRGLRLDGLKIVVDCAQGAAYRVAPTVFHELGAQVTAIGVQPNGININEECGATNTALMREQVILHGADLGVALDGDADRVIIADETGSIMDGDQVMALIASSWHEQDRLRGGGVVSTVMSNLGLERFLQGLDLSLIRTAVGDRYVVERMRADGFNVGGEQSGHIILSDYGTTGDGLVAALQVLAVLVEKQRPVSEVCRLFEPVPQVLRNVRFNGGAPLENDSVKEAIKDGEQRLGEQGRILIRKSGTEPLIRVMAESDDRTLVDAVVSQIVEEIEKVA
ncbi:MAG: phosphoglucosamine mutase [Rhodospirillaceae bacterium]|jgi:phosphoglucosamine mutase|nr:phosphoglucosamine mutase [Rhodospirillaceae bacterium]MBT5665089.1 phosphoglucosamine mutase [Rhodospirillaceae bacterium]